MKLNPKKCVFGVRSGKFLGFMVSKRGIDANPTKVQAALDLPEPKTKRDIQRLTGRMAALSRFISKASDKGLPFFKALKFPKSKELIWEDEQKEAFQQLREHLENLPTLARPAEGEILYLYVAVSPATVSAVLLKEEEKVQQLIYFVSHTLTDAETRYPLLEKVAYAVVVAARKLRPYFDSHQIVVLTDQPLEKVLGKEILDEGKGTWTVFTDGSTTVNGSGAGVVITSPEGKNFEYALKFSFKASNNEAKYEAAVAGLELCIALEAEHVCLKTDSQLVANLIRGEYEAKEPSMISYLAKIKSVIAKLRTFETELIPRAFKKPLADTEFTTLRSMGVGYFRTIPRGSLPEKWLIVGIDYFSKWIEAEAASNITEQTVRKFIWQNIITRFGIPKVLVFDHGRQFDNLPLRRYTNQFGIKLAYSAVCHPQSNGQAEAANKQILNALKKRVEDQKSKWIEELPGTLWSLRTIEKEATGHSPFELVYGSEAVLPVEIGSESLRVNQFSAEENEHLMKESSIS
ncbi:uncharacterized protein LOC110735341 [Chenopodium quinoa]|uniref:uncharacterized protein LOC110735341 n=1 Tax=Chenopodium quinoa TaxID=63459 RepID=UPI000B77C359|nr:uncharacterized protein LOC110735341 [Chenopodium quinoa]